MHHIIPFDTDDNIALLAALMWSSPHNFDHIGAISKELNVPMTAFFEDDPILKFEFNPLTKKLLRRWETLNEKQKKDLLDIMSLMRK